MQLFQKEKKLYVANAHVIFLQLGMMIDFNGFVLWLACKKYCTSVVFKSFSMLYCRPPAEAKLQQ